MTILENAKVECNGAHGTLTIWKVGEQWKWKVRDDDKTAYVGERLESTLEIAKSHAMDCWQMYTNAKSSHREQITWIVV